MRCHEDGVWPDCLQLAGFFQSVVPLAISVHVGYALCGRPAGGASSNARPVYFLRLSIARSHLDAGRLERFLVLSCCCHDSFG